MALLPAQEVFPPLKAANLNGKDMAIPAEFEGDYNLVVIAFKRKQQANVDTWLKPMTKIAETHKSLRYYELPTIDKLNPVTRWFINNGMRSGIPDKAQRARTITLYIDKKPFKSGLKLPSEDTIHALLLDRAGLVVWRATGDYTEDYGKSLEQFLSGK
ncbi:MAG: hypothetical protein ABI693_25880 [Bryobacteraceae bacterium]